MIFKLGLTGSMGMGKTSTALFFEKHNCGVWDADKAVHRLYSRGGEAVNPIAEIFPSTNIINPKRGTKETNTSFKISALGGISSAGGLGAMDGLSQALKTA